MMQKIQKLNLGVFFFLSGFVFSTWASRIPSIKTFYNLNDAELGSLLFIMPIASLVGLPFSGWLVSNYNSRIPLAISLSVVSFALTAIGFSTNIYQLCIAIFVFSFALRIVNISVNTQSVTLQKSHQKQIIGTLHGLWSIGGISGVALSTLFLSLKISINIHLLIVGLLTLILTVTCYQSLLNNDKSTSGNKIIIGKPDPYILSLGIISFLTAICEGGMFDWSGIYFKEVIKTPVFTYGYLVFMFFMASFRFLSDTVIEKIGMQTNYIISSVCIVCGILIAVIFPSFWCGMLGFSLVGIGTACIMPMNLALAGKSQKYSPGMSISIITTYSITGMLLGPPIIGYLSDAFNLRVSFILFAIAGLLITPISKRIFKLSKSQITP